MRRNGQVINIDWSIGLALLIMTLASSLLLVSSNRSFETEISLQTKAEQVQTKVIQNSSINGYKNSLEIEQPYQVSNIPVDTSYNFPKDINNDSGYIESGGDVLPEENRIISVVNSNSSNKLVYFEQNLSHPEENYDVKVGNWINNSNIQIKTGSPGITSLQVNKREILNQTANLSVSDFSTDNYGFYAHSHSGDLKVYNNSRELILEGVSNPVFNLKNFSKVYYEGTTTTMNEKGTYVNSIDLNGFSIADNDLGISFIGNMTATVTKPDNHSVKAEIENADRVRVRLHESDTSEGERRIQNFETGNIYISGSEEISGVQRKKIEKLENLTDQEFEDQMGLDDGYNISLNANTTNILEKGNKIPLRDIVSLDFGISGLNSTGDFEVLDMRVAAW